MLNEVHHFEDQVIFRFDAVMNGHGLPAGKLLNHFKHWPADARHIDADVRYPVPFEIFLYPLNLPFPVKSVPRVDAQHAEWLAAGLRRCHDDKTGCITTAGRVIAGPYLALAKWPDCVGVVILPCADAGEAALDLGEAEHGVAGVDKLAHIKLLECAGAVFLLDFLDIDKYQSRVACRGRGDFHIPDRLLNGRDKSPVIIGAHDPGLHIGERWKRHVFAFS